MSTPDFTSKAWSFIEAMELGAEPTVTAVDPVCAREIDLESAAVCLERDGWAFFFCSEECHRRFLEEDRATDEAATAGGRGRPPLVGRRNA